MIIAVTGASGRIGRATLAELRASGIAEVWALDRSLPPSGLADRSLYCDLSNPGDVYGAIAGADAVIHLGAHASTAHHPGEQVYANNGSATANVVAACIALRIPLDFHDHLRLDRLYAPVRRTADGGQDDHRQCQQHEQNGRVR